MPARGEFGLLGGQVHGQVVGRGLGRRTSDLGVTWAEGQMREIWWCLGANARNVGGRANARNFSTRQVHTTHPCVPCGKRSPLKREASTGYTVFYGGESQASSCLALVATFAWAAWS